MFIHIYLYMYKHIFLVKLQLYCTYIMSVSREYAILWSEINPSLTCLGLNFLDHQIKSNSKKQAEETEEDGQEEKGQFLDEDKHLLQHRLHRVAKTGWQRLTGCLKLQVVFRKRATKYRALLRKMIHEHKAPYASTLPCSDDFTSSRK